MTVVRYEQSFRDDIPGNVVVDHEDGSPLELYPALLSEYADVMARVQREVDDAADVHVSES